MNLSDKSKKRYLQVQELVGSMVDAGDTVVMETSSAGSEKLLGQENKAKQYRAKGYGPVFPGCDISPMRGLTCPSFDRLKEPIRRDQSITCKTLTTCPCDVDTNATTTDRSAAPAPPSADVLPALPSSLPTPLLLEGEPFDRGGEDGSDAGRRGSRDRNAKGIDTTSWAIRVI